MALVKCVVPVVLVGLVGLGAMAGYGAAVAQAQSGCGSVAVRSPYRGEVVAGAVPVLGSARIDAFQFYKLEWAPADDPEIWSAVSRTIDQPMVNGLLDIWDTVPLADGTYRLKLTVVDTDFQERCKVVVEGVVVANAGTPEATGTPTPTATTDATETPTDEPTEESTDEPTEESAAVSEGSGDAAAGDVAADAAGPTPTLQPVDMGSLDKPVESAFGPGTVASAFVAGFVGAFLLAVGAWFFLARK